MNIFVELCNDVCEARKEIITGAFVFLLVFAICFSPVALLIFVVESNDNIEEIERCKDEATLNNLEYKITSNKNCFIRRDGEWGRY